jgi:hypothetical protein
VAGQPQKRRREQRELEQGLGWNGKTLPATNGASAAAPPSMPQTPPGRPAPPVRPPARVAPPPYIPPVRMHRGSPPATGHGPRAPGARPSHDAAPAVNPGVYPSSPAEPAPFAAPPEGQGTHADATNAYADRMRWRGDLKWRRSANVPQGETQLVHAWAHAVTQYPPQALEVWLTRTEPTQNAYHLVIEGAELMGDWPDRVLYNAVCRKRRQPQIFERFNGRIRARAENGDYIEIMGGDIALPPDAAQATTQWGPAQPPWSPPGYGGPPPGYGAPPGYGGMPPWMMGAPPYGGAPPWGAPPPWWTQQQAATQPPPAAVANDPAALEQWKSMTAMISNLSQQGNQAQADMMKMMMGLLTAQMSAKPAAPAAQGGIGETLGVIESVLKISERFKPAAAEGPSRGITVHNLGDGTRIIEDKDGNIDQGMSIGLGVATALKDGVKEVVKARAARSASASGGPRAPGAIPQQARAAAPAAPAHEAPKT